MKWTNKGHEFDGIGHLLSGKERIYLYGASQAGKDLCQTLLPMLKWLKWSIVFIDADVEKQKSDICGCHVLPPEALISADKDKGFVVVCASEKSTPVMVKTAEDAGFINTQNFFEHDDFLYTHLSVHFLYNLDMVYISSLNIAPSTVCNLNCAGCLNFNPYIKKHVIYDFDSLSEDADALFAVIDLIGRFQITGGEPLLYPKLNMLIEYIGEHYRDKILSFEMVTNGTIIPSDELCNLLKYHKVRVYLDDYREAVTKSSNQFDRIYGKLKEYHIDVVHNRVENWFNLTPDLFEKCDLSESELTEKFSQCGCPWATLANRRISACNYSLYAYKAGIIDLFETEYLDLTKINDENKAELVEFRCRYNDKGYVELCRRCAGFRGNCHWIDVAVQVSRTH